MGLNKRAVSGVVVSTGLILLVLLAFGVVAGVVYEIIKDNIREAELKDVGTNISFSSVSVEGQSFRALVYRTGTGGNLLMLSANLSDGANTELVVLEGVPSIYGQIEYIITPKILNASEVQSVVLMGNYLLSDGRTLASRFEASASLMSTCEEERCDNIPVGNACTDCIRGYYNYVGTSGFIPSSTGKSQWVDKFSLNYTRGSTTVDTLFNPANDLFRRYGGVLRFAPKINVKTNPESGSFNAMNQLADYWGKESVKSNATYQILDINLDDFIGWYRYPIGNNFTTGQFDFNLATSNMLTIIDSVKKYSSNSLFGVVIYAEELNPGCSGASCNNFFHLAKKNTTECNKSISLASSGTKSNCAQYDYCCSAFPDYCCGQYLPISIDSSVRRKIDVVHLYFMNRSTSANLNYYVNIAKTQFPNAEIIPTIYLWGNFSIRYEGRNYINESLMNNAQDKRAFIISVIQLCRQWKVLGAPAVEFYYGPSFGEVHNENLYDAEKVSSREHRLLAEQIFNNGCNYGS